MKPIRALAVLLILPLLLASPLLAEEESIPRLFWPIPPNPLRMEFIGVFASQNDFPKTRLETWLTYFVGGATTESLATPSGIAVLDDGRVLVAERKGHNVRVFDFVKRRVRNLFPNPRFDDPVDILLDPDGRLYVADAKRALVLVFDKNLSPLRALAPEGGFKSLEKLAFDHQRRRLYASDSGLNKVFVFAEDGTPLFAFGERGKESGQLWSPHGLAIDRDGRVFVADTGNSRIQIFAGDGTPLGFFRVGSETETSPLRRPWDIAIDGDGRVHIIDQGWFAFITCEPDGQIRFATGAGRSSNHRMGFARPADIHVDAGNRILVTDEQNGRFCIWQYLTEAYLAEHPVESQDVENLVAFVEKQKILEESASERVNVEPVAASTAKTEKEVAELKFVDGSVVPMVRPGVEPRRTIKCPNCGNFLQAAVSSPGRVGQN